MGIADSGEFLARAVAGGVGGGILAAAWAALISALSGLPWWSPLALYRTRLWGLSPQPLVAAGLGNAVLAGVTWLLGIGLVCGAVFGIVAGALLWPRAGRLGATAVGVLVGWALFAFAIAQHLSLLGPAATADLPEWARAIALTLIGGAAGHAAGATLRA